MVKPGRMGMKMETEMEMQTRSSRSVVVLEVAVPFKFCYHFVWITAPGTSDSCHWKGSPPDALSEFTPKRAVLHIIIHRNADYMGESGFPSIKLAVYSNIQLKECQLWAIISKQNSDGLKFHWVTWSWPVSWKLTWSQPCSLMSHRLARETSHCISLMLGKPTSQ